VDKQDRRRLATRTSSQSVSQPVREIPALCARGSSPVLPYSFFAELAALGGRLREGLEGASPIFPYPRQGSVAYIYECFHFPHLSGRPMIRWAGWAVTRWLCRIVRLGTTLLALAALAESLPLALNIPSRLPASVAMCGGGKAGVGFQMQFAVSPAWGWGLEVAMSAWPRNAYSLASLMLVSPTCDSKRPAQDAEKRLPVVVFSQLGRDTWQRSVEMYQTQCFGV
jgi:hypothetical protein